MTLRPLASFLCLLVAGAPGCGGGSNGSPDSSADTGVGDSDAAEAGCGDTTTDPHNCGACGHVCTGSNGCVGGVCGNIPIQISTGPPTCVVVASGAVYCWGQDDVGQLGDGDATGATKPIATLVPNVVTGPDAFVNVVEVSSGIDHVCARNAAGLVWCWGNDNHGECGQNGPPWNAQHFTHPTLIANLSGYKAIGAGGGFTCGLDATSHVYCWGAGDRQQLGHAPGSNGDTQCGNTGSGCTPTPYCNPTPVKVVGSGGADFTVDTLTVGLANVCVTARVAAFVLTAGRVSGADMADAFVTVLPRILGIARTHTRPLIATVTRHGAVTVVLGERRGGISRG